MSAEPLVHLSPHADDWIFFWGETARAAIESGRRSTFVHVTAGDAGRNDGWWEARERAALAAMGVDPARAPVTANVGGHDITCVEAGAVSAFFLRLPDGMPDGRGSEPRGGASMTRLRDTGGALAAIDGSTAYESWNDLAATIAAIVAGAGPGARVCATEYRSDRNPEDHADHIATADLALALGHSHPRDWFLTYCSYYLPPPGPPGAAKTRAWAAHRAILADHLGRGSRLDLLDSEWLAWGSHEHVRRVGAGVPEPVEPPAPWLIWPGTIADDAMFGAVDPVPATVESDGLHLRHPLTGAAVRLDEAAAELWGLLAMPRTVSELADVLHQALPATPRELQLESCRALISTLVWNRLAVPIGRQPVGQDVSEERRPAAT